MESNEEVLKIIDELIAKADELKGKISADTNLLDTNRLDRLREREKRWQDRSIDQLASLNYLLIVLATGFLGFAFKESSLKNVNTVVNGCNWHFILTVSSVAGMVISIFFGVLAGYNRMIDYRHTYKLNRTRKKFYEQNHTNYKIDTEDLDKIYWIVWYWFFRPKFYKIENTDYQGNGMTVKKKLNTMREFVFRLGRTTRWLSVVQRFSFFLSIFSLRYGPNNLIFYTLRSVLK